MQGTGFLGIWSDIAAESETDYLHWLTREHTQERLGVPGFLGVRVFRAQRADICRYFILYKLESPAVLAGAPYLERLNSPTAWTQRIMPLIRNFVRGGGTAVANAGSGRGGIVMPLPLDATPAGHADALLSDLVQGDRVSAARLFETDPAGTSIATREKVMRKGDRSFDSLLLIEGLDEPGVRSAQERLHRLDPALRVSAVRPIESFAQVFALGCATHA